LGNIPDATYDGISEPRPLKTELTPPSISLRMFLLFTVLVGICGTRKGVISGCAAATGSGVGRAHVIAVNPTIKTRERGTRMVAIVSESFGLTSTADNSAKNVAIVVQVKRLEER
jgi:hypothetical protein